MPELPEVETVKRGLAPAMENAVIDQVILNRPNLRFPFPDKFAQRVTGKKVTAMGRRAKYLLADLEGGDMLVMHLGMSGSFRVETDEGVLAPGVFHHPRSKAQKHDHVVFQMKTKGGNVNVIYNDPRRFGYMDLIPRAEMETHKHFAVLGVEPTGNALDGELLAQLFEGKAAPLKAALLDQRLIAGLGNIYVCEALWRSGLSPKRKAGTIARKGGKATPRSNLLSQRIREVIAEAIEAGGSSLKDHRQTDGSLGYFQHRFSAYDRENEACAKPECKGTIRRIVQSGRSTFYCPTCQK